MTSASESSAASSDSSGSSESEASSASSAPPYTEGRQASTHVGQGGSTTYKEYKGANDDKVDDGKVTGSNGDDVSRHDDDSLTVFSAVTKSPESEATQDDGQTEVVSDSETRAARQSHTQKREGLNHKLQRWMGHDAWDEQEPISECEYTQDGELVDSPLDTVIPGNSDQLAEFETYSDDPVDRYVKEQHTTALVSILTVPVIWLIK